MRILIALKDLKIGGIEKAGIELINYFTEKGYKVTLVLEQKKGELLKELNAEIEIKEYKPSNNKIFRKFFNGFKRLKFFIHNKNKYDASISYATYSKMCSFVARTASRNSILWCHADYLELYKGNTKKVKEFFEKINYQEFAKIVFVAENAKETFLTVFPEQKNVYFCNNLINSKKIYELALKPINLKYNQGITTFLNVGRHDEKQKKLSRIIKASFLLKNKGYKFRVIFVGDGQDIKEYKKLVKKYKLEKNIIFEGKKENPYPYFRIADCIILSSDYEGYPVVFLESYVLDKPVITTNVSDYKDISNGRGIVTLKDTQDIYLGMKNFIENGYKIKNKFNSIKYNAQIQKKLGEILKNS